MLGRWQKLDVGVAHLGDVGDQLLGELRIGVVGAVGVPPPGAQMHLVGSHRGVEGGLALAFFHPCGVGPLVVSYAVDYRGCAREPLGAKTEGVCFPGQEIPVWAFDLILVECALPHLRDKDLPHPGRWVLAHDVPSSVPEVEVSDHRDAPGVRGPNGEARACGAFELYRVRPELFVDSEVVALAEEVKVLLAEKGGKSVWVFDLVLSARLPRDPQAVGHPLCDGSGEETILVDALQLAQGIAAVGDDLHGARPRQEDPYHEAAFIGGVYPEKGERI